MNCTRSACVCLILLALGFTVAGPAPAEAQSESGAQAAFSGSGSAPASKVKKDKEAVPSAAGVSEPEEGVYRIGVEDELQISVWREPELSTMAVVRPDGKITLPLVNDVNVVGLKPDELQTLLAGRLQPFVNEPQVTVIARTIRSRKVYLVGQVLHQGSYPLNGNLTVLELIAYAGGVTAFAKSSSIYVLRVEKGQKVRIPCNYKKALSGKGQNISLLPGDVVVVP
jgi:polysaccharide export outer membrane protein